jgi:hypothetical protein
LVNRVGDWAFLIGLFGLFWLFGTLEYSTLFSIAPMIHEALFTLIALGLLVGAMAKSAQIGLHTWLPNAMEGSRILLPTIRLPREDRTLREKGGLGEGFVPISFPSFFSLFTYDRRSVGRRLFTILSQNKRGLAYVELAFPSMLLFFHGLICWLILINRRKMLAHQTQLCKQ